MASLEITRPDARRAAFAGLIDYAGLFPPAALGMADAVGEYRAARTGSEGWMVNRFICPASRLEELLGVMTATMSAGEEPWRVSVTAGWVESLAADAGAVRTFGATAGNAADIDLVEVPVPTDLGRADLGNAVGEVLRAFGAVVAFEVPWDADVPTSMDVLAEVRADTGRALMAKIRCGGLDAAAFPPSDAVARFLLQAEERSLPVKATAGLHHPFRHTDPTTGFTHHGFVNVLVAAVLAGAGAAIGEIVAVLEETDADAFVIDRTGIGWRHHVHDRDAFATARSRLFSGYGSCSFQEPIDDLTAIGALPR